VSGASLGGTDESAPDGGPEPIREPGRRRYLKSRPLLALAVALVVFAAVGAFIWVVQSSDSDKSSTPAAVSGSNGLGETGGTTVPGVAARVVSVAGLRAIAAAAGRPVYWAGPRPRTNLEYTQKTDGTTYVRYLTGSASAGAPGAGYVVIATYPQTQAYRRVKRIAQEKHMFVAALPSGAIAVTKPSRPQNIYVLFPDRAYQIEVYAPNASETRRLVFGGAIQPVR
jgi:hypothetical protein